MREVVVSLSCSGVLALAGCGGVPAESAPVLLERARTAWASNWHAVWAIEWRNAPVTGPLVVEMWHAADGRLRIETLEAPVATLNGLTLVSTGSRAWLYDVRTNQAQSGPRDQVRIPLADDMLAAMEWLFSEITPNGLRQASLDELESGAAWRLQLSTASGNAATLWLNRQTGLPAGLALQGSRWGQVRCVTRRLELPERLDYRLFDPEPPRGAVRVGPSGETTQESLSGRGD
jgi:outer membrane lipoprotein-sorting protein